MLYEIYEWPESQEIMEREDAIFIPEGFGGSAYAVPAKDLETLNAELLEALNRVETELIDIDMKVPVYITALLDLHNPTRKEITP